MVWCLRRVSILISEISVSVNAFQQNFIIENNYLIVKIRIKNLSKSYFHSRGSTQKVLENINLSVNSGDFISILGKSGSGKSSLLNTISGLSAPTSGDIKIGDNPLSQHQQSIFMVFQQPCLLPWLNVEENIAFGCKIRDELESLDYRVEQFIELIGLSGFNNYYPNELSVGMACRVALARALIARPEVLLLDEPFGALDVFTRTRLQEEIINIWLSEQFTCILVTHDIEEAILMGNKIVLLGGHPGSIMDIIDINLKYPRKITDESFFKTKTMIMSKFKKAIIASENIS